MTPERLKFLTDLAARTCGGLTELRNAMNFDFNGDGTTELEDAMRAVVRLDEQFGKAALDILRRNVA